MRRRPIHADDPNAIEKLGLKLKGLETAQAVMKATNAAMRKHKKAGPEAQVAAMVEAGVTDTMARNLLRPDFCGRVGFADFMLTNNSAEIRRVKARIAALAGGAE